jgi:hypothetical protein
VSLGPSTVTTPGSLGWSRTALTAALIVAATVSIVSLLEIAGTDRLG